MYALLHNETFHDELRAIGLDIALHQSGIAILGSQSAKLYQLNVDDEAHESRTVKNYVRRNGGGSKYQSTTQNIGYICDSITKIIDMNLSSSITVRNKLPILIEAPAFKRFTNNGRELAGIVYGVMNELNKKYGNLIDLDAIQNQSLKLRFTGNGHADKSAIMAHAQMHFPNLHFAGKMDDVCDALGLAIIA